jgi:hypothetical protein
MEMSWRNDMYNRKMDECLEEGWRLLSDDEVLDIYDVLDGFEIKEIKEVDDED